jgi:hypothetical protein
MNDREHLEESALIRSGDPFMDRAADHVFSKFRILLGADGIDPQNG